MLRGFSLTVNDGETMVVIGFSGTGKSVAIKHVVGLLDPDAGHVAVDGQVVDSLGRRELSELRSRIGFVFQFAALFDSMTIYENVAFGLRRRRDLAESEVRDRVTHALELVDLPGTEQRMPAELSGGMRKRVGLARAIAIQPKYMLYDEPTTGLDPVTSAVIDELMVRTREALGVTSIVITHDMRSAYTVGDRIAMLYEGRIRQVGRWTTSGTARPGGPGLRRGSPRGAVGRRGAAVVDGGDRRGGRGRVKRANEALVGISVLGALAIMVAGSVWLSQARFGAHDQIAEARFRSIGGLQPGNKVLVRGVPIGRVETIALAPNAWVNVKFRIRGDAQLPPQPAAIILSTTLFGDWGVDIVDTSGVPDDPEVRRQIAEARAVGRDRWPGATLPAIGELTAQAGRIAGDIATIAGRVEAAFDTTSARRLQGAFVDLSNLSRRMSQIVLNQQAALSSIGAHLDTGSVSIARGAERWRAPLPAPTRPPATASSRTS